MAPTLKVLRLMIYLEDGAAPSGLCVYTIEIIEYIECSCVDCTCSSMDRENIAPSATFSIHSIAADLGNKKISFPFSPDNIRGSVRSANWPMQ
jgi:hypothetical protein